MRIVGSKKNFCVNLLNATAYGQNPDKNGQNGCFLKMLWPKLQNVLTMLIYIFMGFSNFSEDGIFFAEKILLCQRSKF